jgi:hypothetical protein
MKIIGVAERATRPIEAIRSKSDSTVRVARSIFHHVGHVTAGPVASRHDRFGSPRESLASSRSFRTGLQS